MKRLSALLTRRKIAILIAVGVLALGLTAAIPLAQGGEPKQARQLTSSTDFADRVAEILGLEGEVVRDAFTQARRGEEDESYKGRLDLMVERGRLTQEEADERYSWFQGRPDSTIKQYGQGKQGGRSFFRGRHDSGKQGWHGPRGSRHGRHGRQATELAPEIPATPNGTPSQ